MLTVKHIDPSDNNAEKIYAAKEVIFRPAHARDYDRQSVAPCVSIIPEGSPELSPDEAPDSRKAVALGSYGKFYVMNRFGQTIATYDLGGWADSTEAPAPRKSVDQYNIRTGVPLQRGVSAGSLAGNNLGGAP